jgi:translation initiation factor eIF-2B subunit delta
MSSDAPAQVPTAPSEPAPVAESAPTTTTPAPESATPNATKPAPAPKGGAKDPKTPAADGEKKLTGAELKAKAKAEKLARRAQTKAATVTPASSGGQAGGDAKGGKSKQKQDGPQPAGGAKGQQGKQAVAPTPVVKDDKPAIPECYSHLSMAKRIKMTQADKDVHPAVLVLGQQMSAFALNDSTARLEAMLQALKKVCVFAF